MWGIFPDFPDLPQLRHALVAQDFIRAVSPISKSTERLTTKRDQAIPGPPRPQRPAGLETYDTADLEVDLEVCATVL